MRKNKRGLERGHTAGRVQFRLVETVRRECIGEQFGTVAEESQVRVRQSTQETKPWLRAGTVLTLNEKEKKKKGIRTISQGKGTEG